MLVVTNDRLQTTLTRMVGRDKVDITGLHPSLAGTLVEICRKLGLKGADGIDQAKYVIGIVCDTC